MKNKSGYQNENDRRQQPSPTDVPSLFRSLQRLLVMIRVPKQQGLERSEEGKKEKMSLLGLCLPRSVIRQIQHKIKHKSIETSTYTDLITNHEEIYFTQKSAIGASASFINRKQRDSVSIDCYCRALNDLGNQCECKEGLLQKQASLGPVHRKSGTTSKAVRTNISGRGRNLPRTFMWMGIHEQTATINTTKLQHKRSQKAMQ